MARSFRYPNVDQRIGSGFVTASHDFKLRTDIQDLEIGHSFLNNNLKISQTFYYMNAQK